MNGSIRLAKMGIESMILHTFFAENSSTVGADAGQITLFQNEAAFVTAKPVERDGEQIPDSISYGTAPPFAVLLLLKDEGGAPTRTGPDLAVPCGYFGCTAMT